MTAAEFNAEWNRVYPGVAIEPQLISLKGRPWFRIHSLPASKRYADTQAEWDILLSRHNRIFNDLFGVGSTIHLVTGEYFHEGFTELHPISSVAIAEEIQLTSLETVDLQDVSATYEKGQVYRPMFATITWADHGSDAILKAFANDELDGFFVSFQAETIIAPYDGGIDFSMKDEASRDHWKSTYRDWLSPRPDGM
jgi:hypothetical protein